MRTSDSENQLLVIWVTIKTFHPNLWDCLELTALSLHGLQPRPPSFHAQWSTPNSHEFHDRRVLSREFQQPYPAGTLECDRAHPGRSSLIIPRLSKNKTQS